MNVWNPQGNFSLSEHDTHEIANARFRHYHWGTASWGMQGETFAGAQTAFILPSDKQPIAGQRYYVRNGQAYLFGKEDSERYGFVRYILGNVWTPGQQTPTPVPLFPDPPGEVPTIIAPGMNRARTGRAPRSLDLLRTFHLTLDLFRGNARHLRVAPCRVMYAINLWITGPYFPNGGDAIGKKPLVFDLAFHTEGSPLHGGLRSFESSSAHHYQEAVGAAPLNSWRSFVIPLTPIIKRALNRFGLQAEGAAIYQLEFLIELVSAEASALIDNFFLTYR